MAAISRHTFGKAVVVTFASVLVSALISMTVARGMGGTYDGVGLWLSVVCPVLIAFPASVWQFHQGARLRQAHDDLALLHVELDRMHSELMGAHRALQQKARHDAMTGGLTREAFLKAFEGASGTSRRGALLIADADNFKRINDSFGHQTGDEALVAIATAIRSSLGARDFWGRIGGEEFAIFLDDAGHDKVAAVAETIRRAAEATDIRHGAARVPVSVSIGGVCFKGQVSVQQAMSDADRRLYRAKNDGRNRVVLDDGGDAAAA